VHGLPPAGQWPRGTAARLSVEALNAIVAEPPPER
jgi:hypothetical protein